MGGIGRSTAKHGPYAGQEFTGTEWFYDVIVSADFEHEDLVDFFTDGAQDDEGRLHSGGANPLAYLDAGHPRHPQVDEDEARLDHQSFLEAGFSVPDQNRAEAFLLLH